MGTGTSHARPKGSVELPSSEMVHVRVSGRVKKRAEKALRAMGLSTSDAVRMLLVRVAAEQALPFRVCVPHVPNAKTRAALREAGKKVGSVDALFAELNDAR